jgi:hypothetical protein
MTDRSQFVEIEVSATELRSMFLKSDLPTRIAAGELHSRIIWERRLRGGGFSRITAYMEPGEVVKLVVFHQRIRADGSTTPPDPKMLRLEGRTYWTR